MKIFNLLLIICLSITGFHCSEEQLNPHQTKLIGTWVEKNPQQFDGVSDTLVFTNESVEKYFLFNGWRYHYVNDTITISNDGDSRKFLLEFINPNEIVLYNFKDRLLTAQVKDIHYVKISTL